MEETEVFFFAQILRAEGRPVSRLKESGGGSRAYKDHTGMYGMQTAQLQHDKGQKGSSGQDGDQEVLQIL